jgi:hypothetical protein
MESTTAAQLSWTLEMKEALREKLRPFYSSLELVNALILGSKRRPGLRLFREYRLESRLGYLEPILSDSRSTSMSVLVLVSNSGYLEFKGYSAGILPRKSQKEGSERVWLARMEDMEVRGPYPLPLTK